MTVTAARLLTALRAELVASGVVRDPRTPGALPPMWLSPRSGTPAPGEGAGSETGPTAVLAAFRSGGIPPAAARGHSRRTTVDVVMRVTQAPIAEDLDAQLRAVLAPAPLAARYAWAMGGLQVIESRVWRELGPLGFDEQAFSFVASFLFETYAPA